MSERPIIARGNKVALAPLVREDLEKFWYWVNDKEITQYLSDNLFRIIHTFEMEKNWLEKALINTPNQIRFAILEVKKLELIGIESIMKIDWYNRHGELGIFIGDKRYWGLGYGTEAIILLLDYAFNILNLNKIYLRVIEYNVRAIRAYKKIGFRVVGRLRNHRFRWGRYWDEFIMDILAEEFKSKHKSIFRNVIDKNVLKEHHI